MKSLKLIVVAIFAVALALTAAFTHSVRSQSGANSASADSDDQIRRQRFSHNGVIENEGPADPNAGKSSGGVKGGTVSSAANSSASEAPTGFDNLTNGFTDQGPPFETLNEDNVVALRSFNDNRFIFEEVEGIADGLGPTYNAQSCRECHQNVATGGASQVTVLRTGRTANGQFFESFGADAYLNELGITSPLLPVENTSSGRFVGFGAGYDPVPEPEDNGTDLKAFANFMRSTKAPARGAITADVPAGEMVFKQIGCAICHVSTITTAQAGTSINGGAFTVPDAPGNKLIHPYSDFLLHNVGTGDGIPVL